MLNDDEYQLLKRWILDEMVLRSPERDTYAGILAWVDQQKIQKDVWDIVTHDGKVKPYDHLYAGRE